MPNKRMAIFLSPRVLQVLPLPSIASRISKVVFHSEDTNIFMTIEQRCWTLFVYCPVTTRGPEVRQIDTIAPPVSYQPLLLSCGVAACQLDNGQVSRHEIEAVQVHEPEADDYNAHAHTRYVGTRQSVVVYLFVHAAQTFAKTYIHWPEVVLPSRLNQGSSP